MTDADRLKLSRMTVVSRSLKDAAHAAWEKGHLREATGLYARADIAESRARDFGIEALFPDVDARIDSSELFKYGRPIL